MRHGVPQAWTAMRRAGRAEPPSPAQRWADAPAVTAAAAVAAALLMSGVAARLLLLPGLRPAVICCSSSRRPAARALGAGSLVARLCCLRHRCLPRMPQRCCALPAARLAEAGMRPLCSPNAAAVAAGLDAGMLARGRRATRRRPVRAPKLVRAMELLGFLSLDSSGLGARLQARTWTPRPALARGAPAASCALRGHGTPLAARLLVLGWREGLHLLAAAERQQESSSSKAGRQHSYDTDDQSRGLALRSRGGGLSRRGGGGLRDARLTGERSRSRLGGDRRLSPPAAAPPAPRS